MGLVQKPVENSVAIKQFSEADPEIDKERALRDGALDTLCSIIRVFGEESFTLASEHESSAFPTTCKNFASHVENGAAVPEHGIEQSEDGRRTWSVVQRVMVDRRRNENRFVTERINGYRGIVDDLLSGLREISRRDQDTEEKVRRCLETMQQAIAGDELSQIKTALSETISQVNETFSEQRASYESQLRELNDRMSNLREDLISAREEMKRDALTQAFNRRAFDAGIKQSVNMHFFSRQPVTLLMIDLDNFKHINDRYGHSAGDSVLKAIGECLARSFIRKNDLVARYGGDEFAVILADTNAKHVSKLTKRFLSMVRKTRIEVPGDDGETSKAIDITCSVGYTEILEEDSVESFLGRADKALFKAKAGGRDRSACL